MRIAVITLFPEMFSALTDYGVSRRAFEQKLLSVRFWNPRDFTKDRHQTVDARPYGGGPGMVMMVEPLKCAIDSAKKWLDVGKGQKTKVIYFSPQGRVLSQPAIVSMAKSEESLILIAGRYEGIDERLLQTEVDEEWSVGDYVLSGGELPAMVLLDAMIRLLPSALGHAESAIEDSFSVGREGLLDCPHYTRPETYNGLSVPEVLLSGNHQKIKEWRLGQSVQRTRERRPDLLKGEEQKH